MLNDRFFVYTVASFRRAIYKGMTKDISVRVQHHKSGRVPGFSSKYRTNRLVWCEVAESFEAAREREAQIKRWRRSKKIALIEKRNPHWLDLAGRLG
ncbi:MAG: GIY-YIG nuclease family protein [Chloroflexi bacterium]|nr:GIY-YIG nuclease family protein [Chloroflexota bacterium]